MTNQRKVSRLPPLMLLTNSKESLYPILEVVETACRAGVKLVQIREKTLEDRSLYSLCLQLKEITTQFNAKLIINSRLDIANAINADGIHLPENALPVQSVRKFFDRFIGRSVHDLQGAINAENAGADYLMFGHVFASNSKDLSPKGLDALNSVVESVTIPVYAVGGIQPNSLKQCLQHGASGIAVMSGIMGAEDVFATTRLYLSGF